LLSLLSLASSTLKSVTFIFVLGLLLKEASVQVSAVMDISDILNALREIGRSNDSMEYGVSETMDRLLDFHTQRGISEHQAGN
jgi:hypothetical protein